MIFTLLTDMRRKEFSSNGDLFKSLVLHAISVCFLLSMRSREKKIKVMTVKGRAYPMTHVVKKGEGKVLKLFTMCLNGKI